MGSNSGVPSEVGVDFCREYCSLVKPDANCWRPVSGRSPYDHLLAHSTARTPSISRLSTGGPGWFDRWPVELRTEALESMDFKSLSTLSRESVLACNVVRALPAYHEVMEHAKGALSVLAATGLLAHHSASSLRRPFRVRLRPPDVVGSYFGLAEGQLASIPKLRVLEGTYAAKPQRRADGATDLRGPDALVSVKQAQDLAAKLGVCPVLAESWEPDDTLLSDKWEQYTLSSPEGWHGETIANFGNFKEYPYSGASYVRFPFLHPSGRVDRGRWCRGCLRTRSDLFTGRLHKEAMDEIGKQAGGGCVPTHITTMASRLWSEDEFMKHVTHCYGARVFSRRWHDVHQEMQQRGFRPRKMAPAKHITTAPDQSARDRRRHTEGGDSYPKRAVDARNKALMEEYRQYVGELTDYTRPLQIMVVPSI